MDGDNMLTKSQRFILGCFILLLVDVIWVSSSELKKFIYIHEQFEKPFFCTYLKTSMFTVYLLGFCLWPPWRDYCNKPHHNYIYLDSEQEDENFHAEANTSLSNPVFVPVKAVDRENFDRSSGTESDDSSIRSVRFNKLAEVRHMSELEATEALLARLSYQASLRAGKLAKRTAVKLPIARVAKIALIFCLLWFVANYTFQIALDKSEAAMVPVLSSTSSLLTLILAAIFPFDHADKFTISKLVAVFISIGGVVLVSSSGIRMESQVSLGIILSILSAFFYSTYIVFLKRKVGDEEDMDIPLFFGFVGLFNLLLLWPLFFFFHYSQWENFELPTKHQLMFLVVNGLLGTVISEALWLWGCFLTSSLMATVAISLTIPMTMLSDVFMKNLSYPYLFYIGTIPMVVAFVGISFLTRFDKWDPVLDIIRCTYYSINRRKSFRFSETHTEQTEALIGINSSDHEA